MFRGPLAMNPRCPVCGHRFEREPGFFQGAMYLSYLLAIPVFATVLLALWLLIGRRIGFTGVSLVSMVIQLFLVPTIWRYSRVLWAHVNVRTRQDDAGQS